MFFQDFERHGLSSSGYFWDTLKKKGRAFRNHSRSFVDYLFYNLLLIRPSATGSGTLNLNLILSRWFFQTQLLVLTQFFKNFEGSMSPDTLRKADLFL